jgi:hypothetical protein
LQHLALALIANKMFEKKDLEGLNTICRHLHFDIGVQF